jgi:DNA-binding response OmpR family regulator
MGAVEVAKILVAVPKEALLTYIADGLVADNHEIVMASSIEDALDAIAETRFDVVISDIFLPVLEGVALLATVARACAKTRIIALIDYTTARARNYELGTWADSILAKPFTIGRIRSEVSFVLSQPARRTVPA